MKTCVLGDFVIAEVVNVSTNELHRTLHKLTDQYEYGKVIYAYERELTTKDAGARLESYVLHVWGIAPEHSEHSLNELKVHLPSLCILKLDGAPAHLALVTDVSDVLIMKLAFT